MDRCLNWVNGRGNNDFGGRNPLLNKKNLLENIKPFITYNKDNNKFLTYYETARNDFDKIINKSADEHILQEYLEKHPILFTNVGLIGLFPYISRRSALFSKIKFGECFETDFAYVHADSSGACWYFIELERADKKMFKKNGDMSSHFNHAYRQILDWQSWIKDNRAYAQSRLGELQKSVHIYKEAMFCVEPIFIIIIGRRWMLNKDTNRRRIEIQNNNPRLKLITYDRLIESFNLDSLGGFKFAT